MRARNALHVASAVAAIVALAGCIIIVRPDGGGDNPKPLPIPLTCQQNPDTPTIQVFFSTRLSLSTVTLTDHYQALMQDIVVGLGAANVHTTIATLVRAGEAPTDPTVLAAWGCRLDNPEVLVPVEVLNYYAQRTPDPAVPGCVTDPLADLGEDLSRASTQYPRALDGQSGLAIFGAAPDAALVVHLDHLARVTAASEPGCSNLPKLVGPQSLTYSAGSLPASQIHHWLAVTPEGVSRAQFVNDCQKLEGFPSTTLDALEPSERSVYQPLAAMLRDAGHPVQELSFCRVLTDPRDFVVREVVDLAKSLGLDPDEDAVRTAIENGTVVPPMAVPTDDINIGG